MIEVESENTTIIIEEPPSNVIEVEEVRNHVVVEAGDVTEVTIQENSTTVEVAPPEYTTIEVLDDSTSIEIIEATFSQDVTLDGLIEGSPTIGSTIEYNGTEWEVTMANFEIKSFIDSGNSDITYVGKAIPSATPNEDQAVWQIQRITVTGDDVVVEWADGDAELDNVWDNRESLTYS